MKNYVISRFYDSYYFVFSFQGAYKKGFINPSKPNSSETYNHNLHRKEVIQPHLPIRLPCYDFTPIVGPTFDGCPASGVAHSRGVTGGVYKARERIHRGMLIRDY